MIDEDMAPLDHNHSFERIDGALTCLGCGCWINDEERTLMDVRHPTPVRLDHYTPAGWVTHTPFAMLLFPERYCERLAEHKKFGRAVALDPETLKPTGEKWEPAKLPARSALVPTDTAAWGLPDPSRRGMCRWCEQYHGDPFDGSCII